MKEPFTERPGLPNITVTQLEYLQAVTLAPTWAKAANDLGVSPSALSQGLAELERRVGVLLFDRQGRRRQLTGEAQTVVRHADLVLAATRDLQRWSVETRAGRAGALHVGMIDAAVVHHLAEPLRTFREQRPEIDLHLQVAPSGELLGLLERAEIEVAVCVDPGPSPDLHRVALVDEPLALYAPDGRTHLEPPTWGPWVSFPVGSHTRAIIAEALGALGASFEVTATSNQPEVLREMVRMGMGWAVLPTAVAEQGPAPLRRARPAPVTLRRIAAVRRASGVTSPAAAALIEALLDADGQAEGAVADTGTSG